MKKLIFLILLVHSFSLVAQKNQLKFGGGIGGVPYEGTPGWNIELQYAYQMTPRLSGFLSLGTNGDNFTSTGRSMGTDGIGTWDNSWQYGFSERLHYVDAGLRHRIFRVGEKYEFKGAVGASFAQSVLNYPEQIFINRGVIEQKEDVTRKVGVGMLLIGVENRVAVTDRIHISLSFNYRTTLKERFVLTRTVNYNDGTSSSTSGILNAVNLALQFGYSF